MHVALATRGAIEAARDYCRSSITFTGAGSFAFAAVVGAVVAAAVAVGTAVLEAGPVTAVAVVAASDASGVAGASSFTVARIHSSL